MALSISIPTEFGIPATYWRLGEYHDTFGVNSVAVMHGFAHTDPADTDTPLAIRAFEILGEQYAPGMDREAIYAVAKTRDEFAGAQDV
jgi:hypothetical protein